MKTRWAYVFSQGGTVGFRLDDDDISLFAMPGNQVNSHESWDSCVIIRCILASASEGVSVVSSTGPSTYLLALHEFKL